MTRSAADYLEWADIALLAVGAGLTIFGIVWVRRRRAWKTVWTLPPAPVEQFHVFDVATALILNVAIAALCQDLIKPESPTDPRPSVVASVAAPAVVVTFLLVVARFRVAGGLAGWGLSLHRAGRDASWAIAAYLVSWPVCSVLLYFSKAAIERIAPGRALPEHQTLALLHDPHGQPAWVLWALVIGALIAAPMAEELLFRGVLQPLARRALGSGWGGVVVASVLFGTMHVANVETVIPLMFFGLVLGTVYAKTRSLAACIMLHVLFNGRTLLWVAIGA